MRLSKLWRRKSQSSKKPSTGPTGKSVKSINKYAVTLTEEEISAKRHRKLVGRSWAAMGKHQLDYLVSEGLQPDSRLLDVGCGALRGGVHFVSYLDSGNYYGIDINESLLRAGLDYEIPQVGLGEKLPPENLRATDDFECDFGVTFDFLLAQSVFTHLPLNHIQLCMYQTAKVTKPGSRFFATFFERPAEAPLDQPVRQLRTSTHTTRDPFHYRPADLEWAATSVADWELRYIGDWGHQRGQNMVEFVRK